MTNKVNVTRSHFNTLVNDNAVLSGSVFTGDVIIGGNLNVTGITTTVKNLDISDNIIGLNNGLTGSSANDSGIIIERGTTGDNAFMGWDESAGNFTVGTTTATAASTGDLTVTVGTLVANLAGAVSGNADTATKIASITNLDIVQLAGAQTLTGVKTLTTPILGTPTSGNLSNCTFPILNQSTSGNAATATKIVSITNLDIVQLAGAQTLVSKTLTAPILTTPVLGTPDSGVLTNCTGLPAANITQGTMVSGMVLVAPVLGTPDSGVLTNCTGLPAANITQGTMVSGMVLVAPVLGTPTSGDLSNCTFPTLNQSTDGNAATATKIASITNLDIVQLTDVQTLTNKTLTAPILTKSTKISYTNTSSGDITENTAGISHTLRLSTNLLNDTILPDITVTSSKVLFTSVVIGCASEKVITKIHSVVDGSFKVCIHNFSGVSLTTGTDIILNYAIL